MRFHHVFITFLLFSHVFIAFSLADTNGDGSVSASDTPDLAKWILRSDGKIQNAATMLCLRRASCAGGQAPNMGPPGVW